MSLKLASMGSVITYAIFTVFPIIMFSIILGKFDGITKKAYQIKLGFYRTLAVILKSNIYSNCVLVSLQDIQLRKAFRSSQAFDQQVVSRDTMPKAMLEAYMACDKPPSLDKLNPYR